MKNDSLETVYTETQTNKQEDNVYIVIPAYNEEENIKNVIEEWYEIVEKIGNSSKLVVIDDGSKDNTLEIMKECAKDKPNFIVKTKENSGHGPTLLYGYNYAIENGAKYIFQTDSDGQTTSKEFWNFWEQREDYDMVIGHRNARKDGLSRKIVTKILKLVIKICFRVTVTDANTPFRLMKANSLKAQLKYIPKDYFLSNVLISVLFEKEKLKVKYIPITFKPRQGGKNSINIKKIVKIGIQSVKDFTKINKYINSKDIKIEV